MCEPDKDAYRCQDDEEDDDDQGYDEIAFHVDRVAAGIVRCVRCGLGSPFVDGCLPIALMIVDFELYTYGRVIDVVVDDKRPSI